MLHHDQDAKKHIGLIDCSVEKRIDRSQAFPTNLSFFQTIPGVASIQQSDLQRFWNFCQL